MHPYVQTGILITTTYTHKKGLGREANFQNLQSQKQMLQVLELIAYAGTKIFDKDGYIQLLLFYLVKFKLLGS